MANIIGNGGANSLVGTPENDVIQGLGGNDTLSGGDGADILSGGDGDDILTGGRGADTLHGGAGNDVFRYLALAELSEDRIVDFTGGDRLDVSAVAGLRFIGARSFSGAGMEARLAWQGNTTLLLIDVNGYARADLTLRLEGVLRLVEAAPGQLMLAAPVQAGGTPGADRLEGGAGDDRLLGLGGDDMLLGGEGDDTLSGGDGNDTLEGGAGADLLLGGAGADLFRYTEAAHLDGDRLGDADDLDRIDLSGVAGLRFIGDAAFSLTPGELRQNGKWLLLDIDGDGLADYSAWVSGTGMLRETAPGSLLLRRAAPVVLAGGDLADRLTGDASADRLEGNGGADILAGLGGDDRLIGGEGNDTLDGGSGNDFLEGGNGDDTLVGGDGDDVLSGGSGADVLLGGAGNDVLRGGSGADVFRYLRAAELQGDIIRDMEAGDLLSLSALGAFRFIGEDPFSGAGMEIRFDGRVLGIDQDGDGRAEITAAIDTGGRLLEGNVPGSLTLVVARDRVLPGTPGDDVVTGGPGADTLTGRDGNDVLLGGSGNDTLLGGNGNDLLDGGNGDDVLEGGLGWDIFRIAPETGGRYSTDTLRDFGQADRIDLTGFRGLAWINDGPFSGVRPEARLLRGPGGSRIEIDADGDGVADQAVLLPGVATVKETEPGSLLLRLVPGITVSGNDLPNILVGAEGDDTLSGFGGNDTLVGWAGNDTLVGGAGNDVLRGETGDDTLLGGEGDDTLLAGLGRDVLTGSAGADIFRYKSVAEIGLLEDRITDLELADRLDLWAIGELVFSPAGLTGRAGQMAVLEGWGGRDAGWTFLAIDLDGDARPDAMLALEGDMALEEFGAGSRILRRVADLTLNGGAGNDVLAGGGGQDRLNGGGGDDRLSGLGGADQLSGGAGNDLLDGGAGNDLLLGEAGDDTLLGGAGQDTLRGGDGNDLLVGGLGADTLTGGAGNDVFRYLAAAELDGDRLTDFQAGDVIDLAALGARYIGGEAFLADGTAQLRSWQLGVTWLAVDANGDGVADAVLSLGDAAPLEETAPGSGLLRRVADQMLSGGAGNDTLAGGAGHDTLLGLGGNDTLIGGAGNDTLDGGAGEDWLRGGLGSDTLRGGTGNDVFRWEAEDITGAAADTVADFTTGDVLDFSSLGARFLGSGAFGARGEAEIRQSGVMLLIDLNGDGFADGSVQLNALPGSLQETAPNSGLLVLAPPQVLTGTEGRDLLTGLGNADTIYGLGGDDVLAGGGGNDTLYGGAGNDTLLGGEGDDILVGGPGADILTGGAGNDRFVFANGDTGNDSATRATITDFNAAPYADQLDLSGIDANLTVGGDQAFTLNLSGSFTGPGQLIFADGVLSGNVDADLGADFQIALPGVASLAAWNFWVL
ncbi:M10 family metallopeptidase C-terminal domain-containing protein [Pseudoroseomonas cervicalis]|uniref:M10 family metallopeptidase C-terminal domain-containing protein n=1 Tax=Teichococcus cervicalis TaxID=204525 RepID=UPI0022F1CFBA|nr:hypothetical protein [Pseudoroseomonas cervicalis]WBV42797.1 hypothetical protein PFY06_16435 [Pseudoroseomonas cervicalis]